MGGGGNVSPSPEGIGLTFDMSETYFYQVCLGYHVAPRHRFLRSASLNLVANRIGKCLSKWFLIWNRNRKK